MKPLAIGVCSGSLNIPDARAMFHVVNSLGIDAVQISGLPFALAHKLPQHLRDASAAAGIPIISASITHTGEDYTTIDAIRATGGLLADYETRIKDYRVAGQQLAELGVTQATTHIGFIPSRKDSDRYRLAIRQVSAAADVLAQHNVRLALETGQESAVELRAFLSDLGRNDVGINMDPANMILYGQGDPVEVVELLAEWIVSVHCKDAVPSDSPGQEWGREVPFGTGRIQAELWLRKLLDCGFQGPLVIERESGQDRIQDVAQAVVCIRNVIHSIQA